MKIIDSRNNGDHPISRIDGRIKLLVALALLVMIVSSKSPLFPMVIASLSLIICLSLRVRPRLLVVRFAEPLFIAAVIMLLKSFSGSSPLWNIHLPFTEITIYKEGVTEGFRLASRITGGVAVIAAVGFSTGFTELMAALSWLRVPREITEVALYAWRYLFVLADDAQVIHAAQKNRLGYVGIRRSFRSIGTLAGALVIKAFDASQSMTTAMVQRGYDGNMPLLKQRPLKIAELLPAIAMVMLMGFLWRI